MKKFTVVCVLLFMAQNISFAQKMQISAGFMLVPMAGISLQETELKGFQQSSLIFGAVSITNTEKKYSITPFYSFTANAPGVALFKSWNENFSSYIAVNKALFTDGAYCGLGFGAPVAGGRATAFVEFGSSYLRWTPGIYTGIFIPFLRPLKKKE